MHAVGGGVAEGGELPAIARNDGTIYAGGYCAPFDVAICVLLAGAYVIQTKWSENFGEVSATASTDSKFKGVKDGMQTVLNSRKIWMCGAISSFFEGSMYTFVFMWTPALMGSSSSSGHRKLLGVERLLQDEVSERSERASKKTRVVVFLFVRFHIDLHLACFRPYLNNPPPLNNFMRLAKPPPCPILSVFERLNTLCVGVRVRLNLHIFFSFTADGTSTTKLIHSLVSLGYARRNKNPFRSD